MSLVTLSNGSSSWSSDALAAIAGLAVSAEFPAGVGLTRQDTTVRHVHLIDDGVVKLTRIEGDADPVIVGLRFKGWIIGAPAVILEIPAPVTVETLVACRVQTMPAQSFRELLARTPTLSWQIHLMTCGELVAQSTQLADLGTLPVRRRVERLLVELAGEQIRGCPAGPVRVTPPLKHYELAQADMTTPPHLSRVLNDLEKEGLVRRQGGWIVLPDPKRLWSGDPTG
jgi:CRP/FNR family cyclic AMP-dependent transcriptional regulator